MRQESPGRSKAQADTQPAASCPPEPLCLLGQHLDGLLDALKRIIGQLGVAEPEPRSQRTDALVGIGVQRVPPASNPYSAPGWPVAPACRMGLGDDGSRYYLPALRSTTTRRGAPFIAPPTQANTTRTRSR